MEIYQLKIGMRVYLSINVFKKDQPIDMRSGIITEIKKIKYGLTTVALVKWDDGTEDWMTANGLRTMPLGSSKRKSVDTSKYGATTRFCANNRRRSFGKG